MDSFIVDPPVLAPVTQSVLGIWSSGDFALTERQMLNSQRYCPGGFSYVRLDGYGHWIPLEAPDEVSRAILSFLGADEPAS
jgi:pimeloyl-ACP methyl ester carboxylesterase